MSYQFNPHNHVKIWLSKKPESFLNFENQKRLIKMRYKNPNDNIHFVYAESLLNDDAKLELADFCKQYQITPVSVEKDVIPECTTKQEKALAKWYQHEIEGLFKGGNPAAASDLLRWLGPVYRLGTYSDFDVDISTHALSETVTVRESLLLNMGSMNVLSSSINLLSFNNDVIAVVDEMAAMDKIQKAQDGILNAYTNAAGNFSYAASSEALFKEIPAVLPWFLADFFVWVMDALLVSLSNAARELDDAQKARADEGKPWLTPAELRGQLTDEKENKPFIYAKRACRAFGYDASDIREDNYIHEVSKQYRKMLTSKTNWLGWCTRPSAQYQELCRQMTLSDEALYQIVVDETFRYMNIQSVLNSTGPSLLLLSMFGKMGHSSHVIKTEVAPYAFSQYGLGDYFDLSNGEKMGASVFDGLARLFSLESAGEVGDISWIESGAQKQQVREEAVKEKIADTSAELPLLMVELLDDMASHRDNIQSQLDGCFGFYRNESRHEKIAALDAILAHAKDGQFKVADFYANLHGYYSAGIEAALFNSQTKCLIDRCEKLCEKAIFCDMKTINTQLSNELTNDMV